jgi:mono/diheme cytochrome c family protein
MGIPIYPHGTYVSRNLTPDPETGLGNWSKEEIANAIRNGRTPERGLNLWGMPWMFFHSFEQDDALAIATYLKTRPPVRNRIPPPLRYGVLETVIAKALHSSGLPPIGNPRVLIYKAGNYGQTKPDALPRDWPQQVLIGAQWLVLLGGLIVFLVAGSRRFPRGARGWTGFAFAVVGVTVVSALGWTMYNTPVLSFVPPDQIGRAVTASIYAPDPDDFANPQQAALAARGRYLFTVTSCAFCHGNDGSGGAKISMRSFGTLWVRNITPDRETGIGAWSDAEIARAIRSGVSRDGGVLHWQGMVWDHLSNLDEEDVRALIGYLRALPPIGKEIPAPKIPSPGDCKEYTFFLFETNRPGCE